MKKIIPIFITILIVIIVLVFPKSPKENLKNFDKENDETVKDIELVTSEDITYDKFTNLIGKNVSNVHINLGPNSYLRNRPSEEIIKRENLQKYINIQESLAKRVEKRYLDNLSYEVISNSVNGEEECKTFEITTYYYSLYLTDLINLTNELASYKVSEVSEDEQASIDFFKSQVKAMMVLDKHLDDYENKTKEKVSANICYVNGEPKSSDEILGFIGALQGENYSNNNFSIKLNLDKANNRLTKYLKEAENIEV